MTHSAVPIAIAWLTAGPLGRVTDRIASLLPEDVTLPAVAIPTSTGAPVADGSGTDTIYDWVLTLYCLGGRTGPGDDFPNWSAAEACQAALVEAVRELAVTPWTDPTSGATLIDAEIVAMTRATDQAGGALVTVTLAVRVAE
jgi:hypothetical protein